MYTYFCIDTHSFTQICAGHFLKYKSTVAVAMQNNEGTEVFRNTLWWLLRNNSELCNVKKVITLK